MTGAKFQALKNTVCMCICMYCFKCCFYLRPFFLFLIASHCESPCICFCPHSQPYNHFIVLTIKINISFLLKPSWHFSARLDLSKRQTFMLLILWPALNLSEDRWYQRKMDTNVIHIHSVQKLHFLQYNCICILCVVIDCKRCLQLTVIGWLYSDNPWQPIVVRVGGGGLKYLDQYLDNIFFNPPVLFGRVISAFVKH